MLVQNADRSVYILVISGKILYKTSVLHMKSETHFAANCICNNYLLRLT